MTLGGGSGNASGAGYIGEISMIPGAVFTKIAFEYEYQTNALAVFFLRGAGIGAPAANGLRLKFSSGNIASGAITMYGLTK
jgi:hypothetical protein